MKDKKIKMVALDLDGTTLNNEKKISERTVRAFKAAMEKGVHIVISTGRTFQSLPAQLFSIEGLEYIITSNGAHITAVVTDTRIYENYVPQEAVGTIAEMLEGQGISVEAFVDGHAYIDSAEYEQVACEGSSYRDVEYILTTRNPVENIFDFMRSHKEEIENISINFEFQQEKEEWWKKLAKVGGITLTSSFAHNIEIGGENTSKASALEFLMERLGITANELMACGDSPNDGEMILLAGIGVAVANGEDSIKAMADYVTDTNDCDGVAKAIEKFVL